MSYSSIGQSVMGAFGASEMLAGVTQDECPYMGGSWRDGGCWVTKVGGKINGSGGSCQSNANCPSGMICVNNMCAEQMDWIPIDHSCQGITCPEQMICHEGQCKGIDEVISCFNSDGTRNFDLSTEDQIICDMGHEGCIVDDDCTGRIANMTGDKCYIGGGSPGYCYWHCKHDECRCKEIGPDYVCNHDDGLCYPSEDFECPDHARMIEGDNCEHDCKCDPGYIQSGAKCIPKPTGPGPKKPEDPPKKIVPVKKAGTSWLVYALLGTAVLGVGAAVYMKKSKGAGAGGFASF